MSTCSFYRKALTPAEMGLDGCEGEERKEDKRE